MKLTGVTGTNGKTTTAHLIDGVYRAAGMCTGTVGTVWTRVGEDLAPSHLTTPEAGELQRTLALHAQRRAPTLRPRSQLRCLESPAGRRLASSTSPSLPISPAIILDFHGSWNRLLPGKAPPFHDVPLQWRGAARRRQSSTRPLMGMRLSIELEAPIGVRRDRDVARSRRERGARGDRVADGACAYGSRPRHASLRRRCLCQGQCNAYNGLAAVGMRLGYKDSASMRFEPASPRPPPVAEATPRVERGTLPRLFVLCRQSRGPRHAIHGGSPRDVGEDVVVFGCKGEDRDSRKRRLMGKVAASLADRIILTCDDVYGEDPEAIIREVQGAI